MDDETRKPTSLTPQVANNMLVGINADLMAVIREIMARDAVVLAESIRQTAWLVREAAMYYQSDQFRQSLAETFAVIAESARRIQTLPTIKFTYRPLPLASPKRDIAIAEPTRTIIDVEYREAKRAVGRPAGTGNIRDTDDFLRWFVPIIRDLDGQGIYPSGEMVARVFTEQHPRYNGTDGREPRPCSAEQVYRWCSTHYGERWNLFVKDVRRRTP